MLLSAPTPHHYPTKTHREEHHDGGQSVLGLVSSYSAMLWCCWLKDNLRASLILIKKIYFAALKESGLPFCLDNARGANKYATTIISTLLKLISMLRALMFMLNIPTGLIQWRWKQLHNANVKQWLLANVSWCYHKRRPLLSIKQQPCKLKCQEENEPQLWGLTYLAGNFKQSR